MLLPLGIFFTYKAVKDSAVFNKDAYLNFFRRLIGSNQTRHLEVKELTIEDVETPVAIEKLALLKTQTQDYLDAYPPRPSYMDYWMHGYSRTALRKLSQTLESTVSYLSNSPSKLVIHRLMDFPFLRSLWFYHPTNYPAAAWTAMIIFPVGITGYLIGLRQLGILRRELKTIISTCDQLTTEFEKNEDGQD